MPDSTIDDLVGALSRLTDATKDLKLGQENLLKGLSGWQGLTQQQPQHHAQIPTQPTAPTSTTPGVEIPTPGADPQPPSPAAPLFPTPTAPFQAVNAPIPPPAPRTPKPPKSWWAKMQKKVGARMRLGRSKQAKWAAPINKASKFINGMASPKGAATKAVSMGGDALSAIAPKLAGPVGAIIAVGQAVKTFRDKIDETTEAMQAHNRALAEFSGSMGVVMAQREIQETQRNIKQGNLESQSAKYLTEKEQRRKDVEMPIEVLWDNLSNYFMGELNEILTQILEPLSAIAKEVSDWMGTHADDSGTFQAFLNTVKQDQVQKIVDKAEKDGRHMRPLPGPLKK